MSNPKFPQLAPTILITQDIEACIVGKERRDSLTAAALANCAADMCPALGRGEIGLGMTVLELLATTRTTNIEWVSRLSGEVEVLLPRDAHAGPNDTFGSIALVRLTGGRVSSVVYREPQGLRIVSGADRRAG